MAREVSTGKIYSWNNGLWKHKPKTCNNKTLVVVFDLGVKNNILKNFTNLGVEVLVVPYKTTYEEVLKLGAQGILLSNGPGDPEPCDDVITVAKAAIKNRFPIFGICLGHQILAIASGAKTKKMKVGHHGANHPVKDLKSGKVFITSQNHGFVVDEKSINSNIEITHRSLFDNSIQGISLNNSPALGFQGHPEASPGPHDLSNIFLKFLSLINSKNASKPVKKI